MTDVKVDDFLEHYGVKGMRWGVRNIVSRKSSSGKSKKKASVDYKKSKELRKRKTSQLSNKQLKSVTDRQNLEKNFTRLNPSTIKRGTAAATGIMATLGLGVSAFNLYNSPAGKAAIQKGKLIMEAYNQGRRLVRNRNDGQLRLF